VGGDQVARLVNGDAGDPGFVDERRGVCDQEGG
jgi:hypothetical protein